MDYRVAQNRREAFIRWYAWSLQYGDCDSAVWLTRYLNGRYEHNTEEKLWLCWLYGNTYYLPTAWVLKNEFPDYELATIDRITWWNDQNYSRLRYQTDTKYNKGHLPSMFESYRRNVGNGSQEVYFANLLGDNEERSFENVWNEVKKNFHKFGRYTTWFYMQHLASTCALPLAPTSLMFDDYSGSRSHRNGFCYAIGRDDWIDKKLDRQEVQLLEGLASDVIAEMKGRFPHLSQDINFYTMETCLCSFKKIFRENNGRYLGYYLDRQADEINKVQSDGWYGIEWDVLWQARQEMLDSRLDRRNGVNKELFSGFIRSGSIKNLEWMFEDEKQELYGLEALL